MDGMTESGNNWSWLVVFILLASGRGFGFGGNAGYGAGMISNDFMYSNLNNAIGQAATQITNQNFSLERALGQGFAQQAQCCCETNRNIDGVRSDIAGLAGQIMSNNDRNTQSVLSAICDLKTSHLQEENQKLRDQNMVLLNAQSVAAATAKTIDSLRLPCPVPAYPVQNPYTCNGYCGN